MRFFAFRLTDIIKGISINANSVDSIIVDIKQNNDNHTRTQFPTAKNSHFNTSVYVSCLPHCFFMMSGALKALFLHEAEGVLLVKANKFV